MKFALTLTFLVCGFAALTTADIYMHNPSGSNNRLNERRATRQNNNRLFDSQNNARGGYNYGDTAGKNKASQESEQYRMNYFQSGAAGKSELVIEWTNQHGCGGNENHDPHKLNCNLVLQYMCQDDIEEAAVDDSITLRNGQKTNTQAYTKPKQGESKANVEARKNKDVEKDRGLHETWESYDACYQRERNKGLFTADQNLEQNNQDVSSAIFTRQNPNENRRGYECPEERDYYPYWHPTLFRDIAVLAHNESMCQFYKDNSFNSRTYGECVEEFEVGSRKHWSKANNPEACSEAGGTWIEYHSYLELAPDYTTESACLNNNAANSDVKYKWGKPYDPSKIVAHQTIEDACMIAMPEVICKAADWSRVNHLGNGRDAVPLNFTWQLPYFPSGNKKRCVYRMRYNISTDDYAPFDTTAAQNEIKENNVIVQNSVIEQNPLVDIGADGQQLQLAINTAQTGRTFQDRSHVFTLSPRPTEIADDAHVVNLNVRGKRGNIVQVYPAVEYDFMPNDLHVTPDTLIHIQWTGSLTHNNNAPGGDGQTGDAGEGTQGTDKHNLVEMPDATGNFPVPFDHTELFNAMTVVWNSKGLEDGSDMRLNYAIQLASAGHYKCAAGCGGEGVDQKANVGKKLESAPASYAGMVFKLSAGTYHYMCTRNNNFTNRSQKGKITVTA